MRLKTYAAIVTGALAMVLTVLLLWTVTQLTLQCVVMASLAAYYAGVIGTYAVTGRMERRRTRILAETVVTLVREEQQKGKEKTA